MARREQRINPAPASTNSKSNRSSLPIEDRQSGTRRYPIRFRADEPTSSRKAYKYFLAAQLPRMCRGKSRPQGHDRIAGLRMARMENPFHSQQNVAFMSGTLGVTRFDRAAPFLSSLTKVFSHIRDRFHTNNSGRKLPQTRYPELRVGSYTRPPCAAVSHDDELRGYNPEVF